MRSKKFALILAAVLVVTVSTSALAVKNPFADVPADHWAYDSVVRLAAVGLVEGYPDGTYGGTRTLTRYEAAMVFARALARLENLVEEQVVSETAGVKEQITGNVMARLDDIVDELTELILVQFGEYTGDEPVRKSYFDMVTGKTEDRLGRLTKKVDDLEAAQKEGLEFVMTEEAEEVIATLVGELVEEYLEEASLLATETIIEQGVIERIIVEDVDEEVVRAIAEEVLAAGLFSLQGQVDSDRSYVEMVVGRINDRLGRVTRKVDKLEAAYVTDVETINGLISAVQGDVEGLEEALEGEVANLTGTFININNEFANELALFGVRVNELEMLYAKLDARISDVEDGLVALADEVGGLEVAVDEIDERLEAQKAAHEALKAETERVKFSGGVTFGGTTRGVLGGEEEIDSATGLFNAGFAPVRLNLNTGVGTKLSARVGEGTVVNLHVAGSGTTPLSVRTNHYVLEVLSDSLIKRLAVGTVSGDVNARFDRQALANSKNKGFVADVKLGGIDVYVFGGERGEEGEDNQLLSALALQYQPFPVLGLRATGVTFPKKGFTGIGESAIAAGLFGEIAGINYDVKGVLDMHEEEVELLDRLFVDANLGVKFGLLGLKANWAMVNEEFGKGEFIGGTGFYNGNTKNRLRLDADAKLFGVKLAAGLYSETDPDQEKLIDSLMVNAAAGFKLLLPFDLSGEYGMKMNAVDPEEKDIHMLARVGTKVELFGVDVGGSFTYVDNYINGDWRNPGTWLAQDAYIVGANLGYGTVLQGADFNLGYGFELAIPRNDTADVFSNKFTHTLSAKYGFSKDMGLNMAVKRVNFTDLDLDEEVTVSEVSAGLEFKF